MRLVYADYTHRMRTNIELNDELVAEAQRFSGLRTKREVVEAALRDFVARHRQRDMLGLASEALIDPAYDVRRVRASMQRRPALPPAAP
jgi:Arc/MetJ family transcription regulator